ncbi:hypothetical protein M0R72_02990 [Candidatus Pacearchaeota archaeon]|nr:hypothetical protein [Candidatus Pacearchaeota archaeon]
MRKSIKEDLSTLSDGTLAHILYNTKFILKHKYITKLIREVLLGRGLPETSKINGELAESG